MKRESALIVVVATLVTFGRVATFGFTNIEDQGLITRNPNLNPPTVRGLAVHWREPHIGLYIPVTYTVWWALARIGQTHTPDETGATLNPWLFHGANLAMHVINALLVLAILLRLRLRGEAALIGALLFALHPIQVEAVAWTTGMKDVLCGTFAFAALHQYIAAAQAKSRRNSFAHYSLASILFVLAMLSKPAAVALPLMAVAIDRMILARPWGAVARSGALLFALVVPVMIVTRLVQPATEVPPIALWARPFIAGDALAFYLHKLIWPFDLTMAYGRSPQSILASGAIYWTWVAPAALALLVWRSRCGWLAASALLIIAGLAPVLGLTRFTFQQFSTVADRYFYLSMLGVALAAACLVSRYWDRRVAMAGGLIIALFALRTFVQTGTWSDAETLYRHAAVAAPNSPLARGNLAAVLINRGAFAEAAPHAARAVELQPNNPSARRNYAVILDAQRNYVELVQQLEALSSLAPSQQTSQWLHAAREALTEVNAPATTTSSPPTPASPQP